MQATIQFPLAAAALFAASMTNPRALVTGTVASMEWCMSEGMPTQSYMLPDFGSLTPAATEPALSLMMLANALLPESRAMADWERRDADEFFWSQFA